MEPATIAGCAANVTRFQKIFKTKNKNKNVGKIKMFQLVNFFEVFIEFVNFFFMFVNLFPKKFDLSALPKQGVSFLTQVFPKI